MNKLLVMMLLPMTVHANPLEHGSFGFEPIQNVVATTTIRPSMEWQVSCQVDHFTAVKSCNMSRYQQDLSVSIVNGKTRLTVGKNHIPESLSAIKIDERATHYGKDGVFTAPNQIIEQMKNGKTAYTRYQEWPYRHYQDKQLDLSNFAHIYQHMIDQYQQL